ncbi:MAG: hypothetical protein V1676_05595 [Candidatus Diapherotrites archaeon]
MVSVFGKGNGRKGQVAIEYILMSAFLLLVVGVLFVHSYTQYDRTMKIEMTQHAVDSLGEAADQAYALGTGSVLFVDMDLPYGIEGYTVTQKNITLKLNLIGVQDTVFTRTVADLNMFSAIPTSPTRHRMRVSMGATNITLQEVFD